jgi:RND family efflux transporter MFP subunit
MIVEEKSEKTVESSAEPGHAKPGQTTSRPPAIPLRGLFVVVLLAALVGAYVIYTGLTSRARANSSLERATLANSVPTVATIRPRVTGGAEEVVLPGNMQAFVDTPIWARSSGYLKQWHADIGAYVKRGQLLAEIEAPEIDQQLGQARAQLSTGQANLKLAQITAERYDNLFKTDSVAKQDVDNAVQAAAARAADVTSAQANVSRLEQLVAYEKVYAPFDGVITARNVDVGALVNADTNTAGKELFHLASNTTLRVYISVPEVYSRAARPGVGANLTLSEFPGRQFHGVVVRNAKSIDVNSRTLLVEVDVKNPTGELLPGSYASVHLKLPSKTEAVTVPSNTLLFRSEGLRVAVVRNGHVDLVPVIVGRDYGDNVEIVSGIHAQDAVIVNPTDSIASGQRVHTSAPAAQGTEAQSE